MCPVRHTYAHREADRLVGRNRKSRGIAFREFGLLSDAHAFGSPIHLGGDEQVHEEIAGTVKVDAVSVLGVVLHARARTAPEGIVGQVVVLPATGRQGDEVHHHARLGILRAQDAVVECPFIVVAVPRLRVPAEQVPCKLQHVVSAARLLRMVAQLARQLVGLALPVLAIAGSSGAIAAGAGHLVPEVLGDLPVPLVAGQFVLSSSTDDVGDERVDVFALQAVLALCQRFDIAVLHEPARQLQPMPLPRHSVEIGQDVVHSALLCAVQHPLHAAFGQFVAPRLAPARHARDYFDRLGVAAIDVHVHQPGHQFVEAIVRRPDRLAPFGLVDMRLGKSAQVAAATECFLALGQFGDDSVGFGLEFLIVGAGKHERAGGKVVTQGVSTHLAVRTFPAAQRYGMGCEPGSDTPRMQQPVCIQVVQILAVTLHGDFERSVQEPDLLQIEGTRLQIDDFPSRRFLRTCLRTQQQQHRCSQTRRDSHNDHLLIDFPLVLTPSSSRSTCFRTVSGYRARRSGKSGVRIRCRSRKVTSASGRTP